QMGRGIDPRAVLRLACNGFQHGAGRALAIGAGDGDDAAFKAQRRAPGALAAAVQPDLAVVRVMVLAVGEPAVQRVDSGVHTERHCRRARPWRIMSSMITLDITLYGIAHCDSVKKARAWLTDQRLEHQFHDFKKHGVPADRLDAWLT